MVFPLDMETAAVEAFPTSWKKGELIGFGSFGSVYLGFDNYIGRLCAIKVAASQSVDSDKHLRKEIALLSRLRHPNIVQYYGAEYVVDVSPCSFPVFTPSPSVSSQLNNRLHIYLEYVPGGSIEKLLREYGPFAEPVIRHFTRQILCGLEYLHSQQTVHRDIKGANVLIDSAGAVKLADFGMAKQVANSFARSLKGTPYWMAPEIMKSRAGGYDLSVDIWSLGCTVIEMAQATPPWSELEPIQVMYKLACSDETPRVPDFLSDQAKDFLSLCLQRNPSDRPTASQLYVHPWFTQTQSLRMVDVIA